MNGIEDQLILAIRCRKELNDDTKYTRSYFNSKVKLIINYLDTARSTDTACVTVVWEIQKELGERSAWLIESIDSDYTDISNCTPLNESSYNKLPETFSHQI